MLVGVQQLRFIAAGLVVISHAVMTATFTLGYVLPGWVSWLDGVGVVGVEVFFVISGFIMARSVRFESADELRGFSQARTFFFQRLRRVWPIYALMTVFATLLTKSSFVYFLCSITFLSQPVMGDLPVIAFGWTLEFEMFFYLVISVALILPFKRKIYLVTAFLIFTVVVMGMPQTVLNFGIGLIVYLAVKSQRVTKKWGFGLVILSVTYFAFTWSISGNGFLQPGWLLYGVPTGLLVLGLSSTGLGSRPKLFVELGNAS